ncbi:MAG TPA: hypothetical protein PLZ36_08275 [Armatimonadota bacterium]|nr:hypothetical protein [Armatimonadota bacterium]
MALVLLTVVLYAMPGDFTQALKLLGPPEKTPTAAVEKACVLLDSALQHTQDADERDQIYLFRSYCYTRINQYEKAVSDARIVARHNPFLTMNIPEIAIADMSAYTIMAECAGALKDRALALDIFVQLYLLYPTESGRDRILEMVKTLNNEGQEPYQLPNLPAPVKTFRRNMEPGPHFKILGTLINPGPYKSGEFLPLYIVTTSVGSTVCTSKPAIKVCLYDGAQREVPKSHPRMREEQNVYYLMQNHEYTRAVPIEHWMNRSLIEWLDDALEEYHPLPPGRYTLKLATDLSIFPSSSNRSRILYDNNLGLPSSIWLSPSYASKQLVITSDPIVFEIINN